MIIDRFSYFFIHDLFCSWLLIFTIEGDQGYKHTRKQRKALYEDYMSCDEYRKGCNHMDEMFKIENSEMVINAVAILLGDYEKDRKKAAVLILKACLTDEFYKQLMADEELKPIVKALK